MSVQALLIIVICSTLTLFPDLSHSNTRLSLLLNGLEICIYNRSQLYNGLEKIFGLDPLIIPSEERLKNCRDPATLPDKSDEGNSWGSRVLGRSWRDLIPVIKIEICSVSFHVSIISVFPVGSNQLVVLIRATAARDEQCLEIAWCPLPCACQQRKLIWSTRPNLQCLNWITSCTSSTATPKISRQAVF